MQRREPASAGPYVEEQSTTAQVLGRYYAELLENGIWEELAAKLILDAAHLVVSADGLAVKRNG